MSADSRNVANAWYEAAQERGLSTDGYHALGQAIGDFIPADATMGVAYRDQSPVVIAAIPGRLISISVRAGGEGEDDQIAELSSLPLTAAIGG